TSGTYKIRWAYDRVGSSGLADRNAWVDDVNITDADTLQIFSYPVGTELPLASGYSTSTGMEWKNQNDTGEARDAGGFAVQTGSTAINNTSWFERQDVVLTGPAKLTFNWRKTSTASTDKLTLLVSKNGGAYTTTNITLTAGSSDWIPVTYDFTTSGTYDVRWAYSRMGSTGGTDRGAWVDDVRLVDEFAEDFGYPAGTTLGLQSDYTTVTGVSGWIRQTNETKDAGGFAAQAGMTNANSSSYMERDITSASYVQFWYKIQDSSSSLKLVAVLPGSTYSTLATFTGSYTTWQQTSQITIPANTVKLRWVYDRTGAAGGADNKVWVDQVDIVLINTGELSDFGDGTLGTMTTDNAAFVQVDGTDFHSETKSVSLSSDWYVGGTYPSLPYLSKTIDVPVGETRTVTYWAKAGTNSRVEAYVDNYGYGWGVYSTQSGTWEEVTLNVTEGTHTLYWCAYNWYGYEISGDSTNDAVGTGYIDDIQITNGPPLIITADSFSAPAPVVSCTELSGDGSWTNILDDYGNYVYSQTTPYGAHDKVGLNGVQVMDGVVSADIKLTGYRWNRYHYGYLYFRMESDGSSGYAAAIERYQGRVILYHFDGDTYTEISGVAIPSFDENATYNLKVTFEGSLINVYLNGSAKPVFDPVVDSTYYDAAHTYVGLGTYSLEEAAYFDNVYAKTPYVEDNFTKYPVSADAPACGLWAVTAAGVVTELGSSSVNYSNPASFLMNDSSYQTGDVEAKIEFNTANYWNQGLLYFRMQDANNGYAVGIRQNGDILFYKVVSGQLNSLNSYGTGDDFDQNTWTTLRVNSDASGNFYVYIGRNGAAANTLVMTEPGETTYTAAGKVGVGVSTDYSVCYPISFKEVKVGGIALDRQPDEILDSLSYGSVIPINGEWEVADDGTGNIVYIQSDTEANQYKKAIVNGVSAQNGTVQAKVAISALNGGAGTSQDKAYIYFRMTDDGQEGYAVGLDGYTGGGNYPGLQLYYVSGGNISTAIGEEADLSPTGLLSIFDPADLNDIKIEFSGNSIKVYMYDNGIGDYVIVKDEVPATVYNDQGHSKVMVGTYYVTNSIAFDDISVADMPAFVKDDFTKYPTSYDGPVMGNWISPGAGIVQQTDNSIDDNFPARFMLNDSLFTTDTVAETKIQFTGTHG
ncbi:MAG: hypothetical protein WCT15_06800, partial [Candidatus Omnitrophota bacterium]